MKSRKSAANAAAAVLLALSAATAQGQTGGEQIGDFVWNDLNINGIQDQGEPGIEGVTVNLYRFDSFFATTTTAAGGLYLFDGLETGQQAPFYLEFVLPAGYSFAPQDHGGNDALDSDANLVTGLTTTTSFPYGSGPQLNWDAGMYGSQVPEPGTLALVGLGAAGLLAARRRKRTG